LTKELSVNAASTRLRHIVLFGFKETASPAEIDEIVARFRTLQQQVPGIEAFEWGVDNSPEGLSQGHSHAFTLTFASEAARDAYLPHPKHQAFVQWVGPFIKKALVVDYWARADLAG
jgi:quinol monooxygenase YgiN